MVADTDGEVGVMDAGCLVVSKATGVQAGILFADRGKFDIIFKNKTQYRDLPREMIERDYEVLNDFRSVSKLLDYMFGET